MFHTKESSNGATTRYYVTKDGRAIKLEEGSDKSKTPLKLPGIKPLVAEGDIRNVFYKLFDRQAVDIIGVNHGKDVDYLELRKTR